VNPLPDAPAPGRARWLRYYLNPLILSIGTLAYYTPFLVFTGPGTPLAVVQALLILGWLASFLVAWLIALVQIGLSIHHFEHRDTRWKHHAVSAAWTLSCYAIWGVLASRGFVLME
jgi:hypothetical protein